MGKLIGRVTENRIVLSVFDNEATVDGKTVLIRNVKIERFYKANNEWKNNNYYSERDLQNLSIALNRYKNNEFDKKKDENPNAN